MLYLLLAILSMSAYMLTLKLFAVKGVNTAQAIIVNYIMASLIGIFSYGGEITANAMFSNNWWYLALISGALFFASMHLMTASTRIAGVAVTTISSRTALIIPIIYASLFLGESVSVWELVGIVMVITALILIFYGTGKGDGNKAAAVLMPLSVFLIMGAIAVCMKSAQHIIATRGNYATDYPLYEAMNFMVALICAVTYYAIVDRKSAFKFSWKSIIGGVCIGAFNFLVTHSILMALKTVPTGIFYASYNICVVVITALIGSLVFGETLSSRKKIGIGIALVAILVLMLLG